MGSCTRITRKERPGTCSAKNSIIGTIETEDDVRCSSSSGSRTSANQCMSSTDSEDASDEEGCTSCSCKRDASSVMRKRKLMDARIFSTLFSGGYYTKKIKLVHDNVNHKDEDTIQVPVSPKLLSPTSGENTETAAIPTNENQNSAIPVDKDPNHEFSQTSGDDSCNMNQSSVSHKPDKKSDNELHMDEHLSKDNIENDDDQSCESAGSDSDMSLSSPIHSNPSDAQVNETDANSCHISKKDIETLEMIDCNPNQKPSSPCIAENSLSSSSDTDEATRSSEVSTDAINPNPVMSSMQLKIDSSDEFDQEELSLSSVEETTQKDKKKLVENQTTSESDLEEGEIRERSQKHKLKGIQIFPKDAGIEAELQSERRCTESASVSEQKSKVVETTRMRTRELLAQQVAEVDNFKKFMDMEEMKLKEANHELERFDEHKANQRRKLIKLQVAARNREKEICSQWLEDASKGNLSKSFDSIPLPSSGFLPEGYVSASNISVSVADGSHASEQERCDTCEVSKSSGIFSDQLVETKKGDVPSNMLDEVGNEVDKGGVVQSSEPRAEIEKNTQANPQSYFQVSVQYHQETLLPSHGSPQSKCSDFVSQVPVYVTTSPEDTQEMCGLKQIVALKQPSSGASSLQSLDRTFQSSRTSQCIQFGGPKTAIESESSKDPFVSSSRPSQPSQKQSSSELIVASMPASVELSSKDMKTVSEQKPATASVEHEPVDDLPSSEGQTSCIYEVEQGESGSQNLHIISASCQLVDGFLALDAMENTKPIDECSASAVSTTGCVDMIPSERFQNCAVSSAMELRQEDSAIKKRLEMQSVANKTNSEVKQVGSGPQNLIADSESSELVDTLLASDAMDNIEPTDGVSPPQCANMITPDKFQNGALSSCMELRQGATAIDKRLEMQSVASRTSDVSETCSSDNLSCNPHSTNDRLSVLLEKISTENSGCNRLRTDAILSYSQPVRASFPHAHEKEVSVSVSREVPTSQHTQPIPSGYGNSVLPMEMDSKQLSSSLHPFPVSSSEVGLYDDDDDDDVICLGSFHPGSSSGSLSFAVWAQPEASAPRQADDSVPKTKIEKPMSSLPINDPAEATINSLNLQIQSFSNDRHISSVVSDSPSIAVLTPSESYLANYCSTVRNQLPNNDSIASTSDQSHLPSFVQTSSTPHAEQSSELAQAMSSQVNQLTSNDTLRAPDYNHSNNNVLQGSGSGLCQLHAATAQLPLGGFLVDPLAHELSRLRREKELVTKLCIEQKAKLKSEFDIEKEKLKKKYETLLQNAAAEYSEKNVRLDIIYGKVQKNQLLASSFRSEVAGYDASMEIITSSLQGVSSGFREQFGSGLGSNSNTVAVPTSAKYTFPDAGIFSQGQTQSTAVFPVSSSFSPATSMRQLYGSGSTPTFSNVPVPISANRSTSYDAAISSQGQVQGSASYPVTAPVSLMSSFRQNSGAGMCSASSLRTASTSVGNNPGGTGMLPLPASVPSAMGLRHPFQSGMTSNTATGMLSAVINNNPIAMPSRRQQSQPCLPYSSGGTTMPVSIGSYPGLNTAIFPEVKLQSILPSPAVTPVSLSGFPHVHSSSPSMPSCSVAPISSGVQLVQSNIDAAVRSTPPHLRSHRPGMPAPPSNFQ